MKSASNRAVRQAIKNTTATHRDLVKDLATPLVIPANTTAEDVDALFTDPVNNAKVKALLGIKPRTSKVYEATVDYHLESLPNGRGHWSTLHKLKKRHAEVARGLVIRAVRSFLKIDRMAKSGDTIHVRWTRVGPRKLDMDNMVGACKALRDQVAAMFGIDDGSDRWRWTYDQAKGRHAVRIQIWTEEA